MGLNMNDFVQYSKNFKQMKNEFNDFLLKYLQKEGLKTLTDIKNNTPVDTGYLRMSWFMDNIKQEGNKASIEFENIAEYASIIEYGTPARPNWKWADGAHMMTKGFFNAENRMPKSFDKEFTAFLKKKGII